MANLITNPSFDANVTGWTTVSGTPTSAAGGLYGTNGCLITNASTTVNGSIYQDVTTVVGTTYVFSGFGVCGTTTSCSLLVGTSANNSLYASMTISNTLGWTNKTITFVATTTSTRITLSSTAVGGNINATAYFDKLYMGTVQSFITDNTASKNAMKGFTKRVYPNWYNGTKDEIFNVDLTGTLSGTVSIPGGASVLKSCRITVTDRYSRKCVAGAVPAANGTFTLTGLDRSNPNRYFVMCEAPSGYNAIVYDKMNVT